MSLASIRKEVTLRQQSAARAHERASTGLLALLLLADHPVAATMLENAVRGEQETAAELCGSSRRSLMKLLRLYDQLYVEDYP